MVFCVALVQADTLAQFVVQTVEPFLVVVADKAVPASLLKGADALTARCARAADHNECAMKSSHVSTPRGSGSSPLARYRHRPCRPLQCQHPC